MYVEDFFIFCRVISRDTVALTQHIAFFS
jgi:hypothetical protein